MLRIYLFFFVFICGISVSNAQFTSTKVNSSSENLGKNGVFYSLPRLVMQVDVVVTKINDVPGPYAAYANRVLGLTDYVKQEETMYGIKSIHLQSLLETDPNAVYFLDFGERSNKADRSFLVQLQNNGVLKGVNETTSFNEENKITKVEMREDYFSRDFNYYADLNSITRVDTIIRRISVDTTSIEDVVYNRTRVEKSTLERAQDAANIYMDIHKNRLELLSGFQEVNYPAQTIELMNSELRNMETDYLALFKGKRFISEEKFTFYIIPLANKSNQVYPIFKFSKDKGALALNSSIGERIHMMVEPSGLTDILKNQEAGEQSTGFFYRIPESARVWVDYKNTEYSKNTFSIPQLGALQSVNTSKTIISIDPKTGMLKAIEIK